MQRRINLLFPVLFGLFFLALLSCEQPDVLSEPEKKVLINEVRYTLNMYYDEIRRSGPYTHPKYLDNSSHFFWRPPGHSEPGTDLAVVKPANARVSDFKTISTTFDTLSIVLLGRDMVSYTGLVNSTVTDSTGKIGTVSVLETGVLVKTKDKWKLKSEPTSIPANDHVHALPKTSLIPS